MRLRMVNVRTRAVSEDIHHLAGVGPMCVFAVPLTLNDCGTGSLKQGPLAVSGLIALGKRLAAYRLSE